MLLHNSYDVSIVSLDGDNIIYLYNIENEMDGI